MFMYLCICTVYICGLWNLPKQFYGLENSFPIKQSPILRGICPYWLETQLQDMDVAKGKAWYSWYACLTCQVKDCRYKMRKVWHGLSYTMFLLLTWFKPMPSICINMHATIFEFPSFLNSHAKQEWHVQNGQAWPPPALGPWFFLSPSGIGTKFCDGNTNEEPFLWQADATITSKKNREIGGSASWSPQA